jgi:hypothetical protein
MWIRCGVCDFIGMSGLLSQRLRGPAMRNWWEWGVRRGKMVRRSRMAAGGAAGPGDGTLPRRGRVVSVEERLISEDTGSRWFQAAGKVREVTTEDAVDAWAEAAGVVVVKVSVLEWIDGTSLAAFFRSKLGVADEQATDDVHSVLRAHIRGRGTAAPGAARGRRDAAPGDAKVLLFVSGVNEKTALQKAMLVRALCASTAVGLHGCVVESNKGLPAPHSSQRSLRIWLAPDGVEQLALPAYSTLYSSSALEVRNQLADRDVSLPSIIPSATPEVEYLPTLFSALRVFWTHAALLDEFPLVLADVGESCPFVEPPMDTSRYAVCHRFAASLFVAVNELGIGFSVRSRCFVVTGPKGSGKTTLLQHLLWAAALALTGEAPPGPSTFSSSSSSSSSLSHLVGYSPTSNPAALSSPLTPARVLGSLYNAGRWPTAPATWLDDPERQDFMRLTSWMEKTRSSVICVVDEHQDMYRAEVDLAESLSEHVALGTHARRFLLVATGSSSALGRLMFTGSTDKVQDLAQEYPGYKLVRDLNDKKWERMAPVFGFEDVGEVAALLVGERLPGWEGALAYLSAQATPSAAPRDGDVDMDAVIDRLAGLLSLSGGLPERIRTIITSEISGVPVLPAIDDVLNELSAPSSALRRVLVPLCRSLSTPENALAASKRSRAALDVLSEEEQALLRAHVSGWADRGFLQLEYPGTSIIVPAAVRTATVAHMSRVSGLSRSEALAMLLATGSLADVEGEKLSAESIATDRGRSLVGRVLGVGPLPPLEVMTEVVNGRARLVRLDLDSPASVEWSACVHRVFKVWTDTDGVDLVCFLQFPASLFALLVQVKLQMDEIGPKRAPDVSAAARRVSTARVHAFVRQKLGPDAAVAFGIVLLSTHELGEAKRAWARPPSPRTRSDAGSAAPETWAALDREDLCSEGSIFTAPMIAFARENNLQRFLPRGLRPAPRADLEVPPVAVARSAQIAGRRPRMDDSTGLESAAKQHRADGATSAGHKEGEEEGEE